MAEPAPALNTPVLMVVPPPKPLTPKQLRAAILYSQCVAWKSICSECRISQATLSRWFNTPEFKAEVNRLVDKIAETSETKLRALKDVALESLRRAMEGNPGSVAAVRAASIILSNQPATKAAPTQTGPVKIAFGGLRRVVEKENEDA